MKELVDQDLFEQIQNADAICIPTNCTITDKDNNNYGRNPMGGGVARLAANRWPVIEEWYGARILSCGHVPCVIGFIGLEDESEIYQPFDGHSVCFEECALVAYPTMHSIMEAADLNLVARSAILLVELTDQHGWKDVYLAAPGIGIGGLNWENEVKPELENILDDRFTVMRISPKKRV